MVYTIPLPRWLLPATCVVCCGAAPGDIDICPACIRDLPESQQACPRCAMPVPRVGQAICGQCLQRPPRFSACLAAFRYEFPVRELIARFKFHGDQAAGRVLAQLLAQRVAACHPPQIHPALLVPVPLHPRRLRERGFNQAQRIARILSLQLGVPVVNSAVRRVMRTPDQKQLSAEARKANLRGAFEASEVCRGLQVALVDDVITTGATADAIAGALLEAGAADVRVWCLARAT